MSEELKKQHIARRGRIKGSLTRFDTFLSKIVDSDEHIAMELKTRLDAITVLFSEFDTVQADIEHAEPEEFNSHEKEREEFENKYFTLIASAKMKLQSFESNANIALTQPLTTNTVETLSNQVNVKLPSINLPEFSGSYDKWTQFHESFDSLINKNLTLSNVQRFYYLQGALKGEAAQIISSLTATDSNYNIAWDLLTERYQNKKAIIHSHMKGIFDLPNITKESYTSLRKLLDSFLKHFRSLQNLGENVEDWNTILIFLLNSKLDSITRKEWEIYSRSNDSSKINDFTMFLMQRCQLLESLDTKTNNLSINQIKKPPESRIYSHFSVNNTCPLCGESHFIYSCKTFLDTPLNKRYSEIKRFNLCTNCLRSGHSNSECKSTHNCRTCQKRHHSLLHLTQGFNSSGITYNSRSNTRTPRNNGVQENTSVDHEPSTPHSSNSQMPSDNICTHSMTAPFRSQSFVFLSTVVINVFDKNGKSLKCRALLDSGSQSNFITKKLFDKLNLQGTNINIPISGICQNLINISKRVSVKFKSLHNNYSSELSFLIINKITGVTPQQYIDLSHINIPSHINLADCNFNIPSDIDMLLGAEIFFELLNCGQIKLGKNLPCLHETKLGWILAGPMPYHQLTQSSATCFLTTNTIEDRLQNFWRIEENYAENKKLTKEESECEIHFSETFTRDDTGRFTVSLPLKENYVQLGESQEIAIKRFYSIEQRLNKNPELKIQYCNFMFEYENLGHMTEIDPNQPSQLPIYYLPHHCVEKQESSTTKLRVVFDASAKTTSGISLNNTLKIGPTIQNDLFVILIRFRQHNVVMTGDIAKMYRQVNIKIPERDLQRIVWRDNPESKLSHFQLNTVTYGTASASFLSTRCLKQIALEFQNQFPTESDIILNDFYVDDLITGSDSVNSLVDIRKNLMNILNSACFELRKLKSNNLEVLEDLDGIDYPLKHLIADEQNTKTLGIAWNSISDSFEYNSKTTLISSKYITKRIILSVTSQIFDPLGLLGPIIIQAKILLQKLWLANLSWDEPIPANLYKSWIHFYNTISTAQVLKIPRHVLLQYPTHIEIHGFCDSSIQAYGACIYIRSENSQGEVQVTLLCAKSRVAPLKALSLPRLELLGALLLAKLMKKVISSLDLKFDAIYYWTDSTIVLSWIAVEPRYWKTFVCNRISEIQGLSSINEWYHVSSTNNPADIISRGMNSHDLEKSSLWWKGPAYLLKPQKNWPENGHISNFARSFTDTPEYNSRYISLTTSISTNIFEKFSSFSKLINIVSYCLRFVNNAKLKPECRTTSPNITLIERKTTENILIRLLQAESFTEELHSLKSSRSVKPNSTLSSLNPFIDDDGIIRVGGRLQHSSLKYNSKHPILLPKGHSFTTLLIRFEHERNFHAGCQATLSFVRRKYWPLNGRAAVRNIIRKCIKCFKAIPPVSSNQMGNLPTPRVTPSRVFANSGVDYAGPFLLKDGKYRNRKILKCYICIFICLSTKAIHIELASELTTECFIAAFKRFAARRGFCSNMYSDNASNFVGADRELKHIFQVLKDQTFQNYINANNMQWHFIPSRSPHFGGIWEAAVKSIKYHLKRILSNTSFTFEEFYTILTQVEAVLNSRPLVPLTSDPNDLEAITPSHFIIGEPLNTLPELDVQEIPVSHLSRYQHLQKLTQQFWSRWTKDYLHNLHQRNKWRFQKDQHHLIGHLVLLREDNLPPMRWALGRITAVYPGTDGIIRVVSVLTKGGIVKRSIVKVSFLPVQ